MSFARRGSVVSVATRRIQFSGEHELDYKVDGVSSSIKLLTADKEILDKGKTHKVTLVSEIERISDRMLTLRPHPALFEYGPVSHVSVIREPGKIVLWVNARKEVNLAEFEYIAELLVEGGS